MALKLNLVIGEETITDAYINIHHATTLADNTFIAVNYWNSQEDRLAKLNKECTKDDVYFVPTNIRRTPFVKL